jgi:dihydroneopterin aldolase
MHPNAWIKIRDFRIENVSIGVNPAEKLQRQPIIIDFSVRLNVAQAVAEDSIQHTVDYTMLCEHVSTLARSQHFELVETLGEILAQSLLRHFPINKVSIEVHKPRALQYGIVSVHIERE